MSTITLNDAVRNVYTMVLAAKTGVYHMPEAERVEAIINSCCLVLDGDDYLMFQEQSFAQRVSLADKNFLTATYEKYVRDEEIIKGIFHTFNMTNPVRKIVR